MLGVEWDIERSREVRGESLVLIGFCAAQAVVEMGGVQDNAQFRCAGGEDAGEGYRVGPAGEADGQAQTWPQ